MPQIEELNLSKKEIPSGIIITVLLFAVSIYLPILGFIISFLIPLPILYYRSKLGRNAVVLISIGSIFIGSFFSGGVSADIGFFIVLMAIGFSLGEAIDKKFSIEKTIGYACLTIILLVIAILVLYSGIFNKDIVTLISEHIEQNLKLTLVMYKGMGMPQEHIDLLSNSLDKIQYILLRIIPALFIASTCLVTWLSLILIKPIFLKKGLYYPEFGELKSWKAPEQIIWVLIGCGVSLIIPELFLNILGLNGLIVLFTIYFFQGIAIVSFYFDKHKFPILLKVILYSFIVINHLLLLFVIGVGIFDMWLNFRKI
ncbi:MAG: YybS family protein [Desulfobacterales bacterium]|nr:YybS family protein [Desulfobacterales bacterium]